MNTARAATITAFKWNPSYTIAHQNICNPFGNVENVVLFHLRLALPLCRRRRRLLLIFARMRVVRCCHAAGFIRVCAVRVIMECAARGISAFMNC